MFHIPMGYYVQTRSWKAYDAENKWFSALAMEFWRLTSCQSESMLMSNVLLESWNHQYKRRRMHYSDRIAGRWKDLESILWLKEPQPDSFVIP